jgi:hypothetical protein
MEFTNLVELIQVFANEYCEPASIVLVYGNLDEIEYIKEQFKFITSEIISIDTSPRKNIDIVIFENLLPFENHSFDLVISFKGYLPEFKRIIKSNGKLLINQLIVDAIEHYKYKENVFSVIL